MVALQWSPSPTVDESSTHAFRELQSLRTRVRRGDTRRAPGDFTQPPATNDPIRYLDDVRDFALALGLNADSVERPSTCLPGKVAHDAYWRSAFRDEEFTFVPAIVAPEAMTERPHAANYNTRRFEQVIAAESHVYSENFLETRDPVLCFRSVRGGLSSALHQQLYQVVHASARPDVRINKGLRAGVYCYAQATTLPGDSDVVAIMEGYICRSVRSLSLSSQSLELSLHPGARILGFMVKFGARFSGDALAETDMMSTLIAPAHVIECMDWLYDLAYRHQRPVARIGRSFEVPQQLVHFDGETRGNWAQPRRLMLAAPPRHTIDSDTHDVIRAMITRARNSHVTRIIEGALNS